MTSLIKLDYDMSIRRANDLYMANLEVVQKILGLTVDKEVWEKSANNNYHVQMWVKEDLLPLEILAVQLIMGSDPVREAFNLRRIRRGQKNWNILFKPKRRLL